jgi:hypothetical protein
MKNRISFAVLALALVAGSLPAQTVQEKVEAGKGKVEVAQLVELNGTITALDVATRDVTLKTEKGEEISFVAGPDVQRLADLKVGDRVEIQYYESLTLQLSKVEGGTPSTSDTATEMRAEPAELPGGIKSQTTTITAKITAVDAKAGTVTLVGPKGRSVTLEVEADILAKVKVGDLVSAIYTQAVAASVSRAAAN